MRLNRDAQLRLTRLALPLMRPGGRIIFVTSHQAHFYPQKPVLAEQPALPTIQEFAAAIVSAAITPDHDSGNVCVGGGDYLWPAGKVDAP